jgi:hypothetical protein
MTYHELRQKHMDELDNFKGIFHAFTDAQFEDGLEKFGLILDDAKEKVAQLMAGSFILKNRCDAFHSMLNAHHTEKQGLFKDEQFLLRALTYELCNHEYCYNCDETDALDALGLEYDDVPRGIMIKATREAKKAR